MNSGSGFPVTIALLPTYCEGPNLERVIINLLAVSFDVIEVDSASGTIKGDWKGCTFSPVVKHNSGEIRTERATASVIEGSEEPNWLTNVQGVKFAYIDHRRNVDRDDFVRKPGKGLKRVV